MDANGWGWAICDERMVPVMTEMKPAPDYLLDVIHCGCRLQHPTMQLLQVQPGMLFRMQ